MDSSCWRRHPRRSSASPGGARTAAAPAVPPRGAAGAGAPASGGRDAAPGHGPPMRTARRPRRRPGRGRVVRIGHEIAALRREALVRRPAPGTGLGERHQPVDRGVQMRAGPGRLRRLRRLAGEHGRQGQQGHPLLQAPRGVLVRAAITVPEGTGPGAREQPGCRTPQLLRRVRQHLLPHRPRDPVPHGAAGDVWHPDPRGGTDQRPLQFPAAVRAQHRGEVPAQRLHRGAHRPPSSSSSITGSSTSGRVIGRVRVRVPLGWSGGARLLCSCRAPSISWNRISEPSCSSWA